jgi:hypothetical protein
MCVRKLPLQKSSSSSPATAPEKSLMRYGVDSFLPSSWEPQEEGMMNIEGNMPERQ